MELMSLNRDKNESPGLIAIGSHKLAIDQYFLAIEDFFLLLPTKNVIEAIDFLFKAHYVFNTAFDNNLLSFWLYLQKNFYEIECQLSANVIEVYSKICLLKEKVV